MDDLDEDRLLHLAIDLAREAGALLLEGLHRARTEVLTRLRERGMVPDAQPTLEP